MAGYGTATVIKTATASRRAPYVVLAAVAGLAAACVLLAAGTLKAGPEELYQIEEPAFHGQSLAQAQQMRAASYIDKWTKLASPDFQGPMEILAAKKAGIPVIYPSQVIDKSGKLNKLVPSAMLRAIQKPLFNVVPSSQSSKLACICETCKPFAGFPPVCTGCTCEEAEMNDKVWFLGHTKACKEDECDDIKEAAAAAGGEGEEGAEGEEGGDEAGEGEEAPADEEAPAAEGGEAPAEGEEGESEEGAEGEDEAAAMKNALLDFPECETWSCYNKDGWFCACVCPGQGC